MEKLKQKIYFRIRPEDKEKINAKARSIGLSPSAFIRMAALNYRIKDPLPPSTGAPDHPSVFKPGSDRHEECIG